MSEVETGDGDPTEPAGSADARSADAGKGGPTDREPGRDRPSPAAGSRRRAPRTRRISAWILVVLASLLIPVSVVSVWAIRTVTNTDQYVATMAPLARNQVIVEHLATEATNALFSSNVVTNGVKSALPPAAKPIVTPVVNQVRTYVYNLALKVFESAKFGQLWDALNRHTHDAVVSVLTGKQSPLVQKLTKGGAIFVNVTPMINDIIDKLNAHGVTLFNPVKSVLASGDKLGVKVVSTSQVSQYSAWFNLVVKLKWIIPIVTLVLAVLSIVIALERRKTLLRLGVGVALVTVLFMAGISLGRITFVTRAGRAGFDQDVANAVWDTLLRFLKSDLRWTVLISVLVAFGAWVAGPARYAVWIRSTVVKGTRWGVAQGRELSAGAGRVVAGSERARQSGGWVLEHVKGLRALGAIVAALFVVFGGNMTGWSLFVIVLVLAVYLGLLQVVVIWARRIGSEAGAEARTL